jgi:hypothetical protein
MATYIDERWSAAAWWCRRSAVFSVMLAVVAILAHRLGFIDTEPFLYVLAVVAGLALLALVFAIQGFQRVWYLGDRGGGDLTLGVLVAALMLTPFAIAAWLALHFPPLDQATTDLEDPPALARHTPGAPPVGALDIDQVILHQEAYPSLTGRRYAAPIDQVAVAVEKLMESRGWVTTVPVSATDDIEFVIDTVAAVPVLAIPLDVAIRLTDEGNATYIDMRSASRFGPRDLGVNAWLIDDFLTELDQQAGTLAGVAPPTE